MEYLEPSPALPLASLCSKSAVFNLFRPGPPVTLTLQSWSGGVGALSGVSGGTRSDFQKESNTLRKVAPKDACEARVSAVALLAQVLFSLLFNQSEVGGDGFFSLVWGGFFAHTCTDRQADPIDTFCFAGNTLKMYWKHKLPNDSEREQQRI